MEEKFRISTSLNNQSQLDIFNSKTFSHQKRRAKQPRHNLTSPSLLKPEIFLKERVDERLALFDCHRGRHLRSLAFVREPHFGFFSSRMLKKQASDKM